MKKATLALACGETFEGFACGAAGRNPSSIADEIVPRTRAIRSRAFGLTSMSTRS